MTNSIDICAHLKKQRPGFQLEASLLLPAGKVTVLLGPSGSGKTTLLRLLAGLETADQGKIRLLHESWLDSEKDFCLPIQQRQIGFMFQDYALFEHKTVADNIGYGVAKAARPAIVRQWLKTLQLETLRDAYPASLSGGQRQRVALGRAMAIQPKLLLLDEPFSALDVSLRQHMRRELKGYIARAECPVVLVTHDLAEARELADYIYVLHKGRISRAGPVDSVLSRPYNQQAARTLGWRNFLSIKSTDHNTAYGHWGVYHLDYGINKEARYLAFAPQHVRIINSSLRQGIKATVTDVLDHGAYREIGLLCKGGERLVAHRFWDEPVVAPGSKVTLNILPSHMQLLTEDQPYIDHQHKDCVALLKAN